MSRANHSCSLRFFSLVFALEVLLTRSSPPATGGDPCRRSYCGNVTLSYPFSTSPGCGHPAFRDLLFCINGAPMLHLPSGSYRVLSVDYAYRSLTLHDPHMSTCLTMSLSGAGNGFLAEPWRSVFLEPAPDNVFLLLGCRPWSPLFQGFPGQHLPCRNISGMGCEEYYACPAWSAPQLGPDSAAYGSPSQPGCCAVPYKAIRAVNLTRLGCGGYSSAYSLAPVRAAGEGAKGWSYGIRVRYEVPVEDGEFCRACEATGGACGYDEVTRGGLCICGSWNSTSNCDFGSSPSRSFRPTPSFAWIIMGLMMI